VNGGKCNDKGTHSCKPTHTHTQTHTQTPQARSLRWLDQVVLTHSHTRTPMHTNTQTHTLTHTASNGSEKCPQTHSNGCKCDLDAHLSHTHTHKHTHAHTHTFHTHTYTHTLHTQLETALRNERDARAAMEVANSSGQGREALLQSRLHRCV
jgi:hypothetical protein